ncbi:MAG: GFA family protein [Alphaproteobacteria bacterium]|nr:GFA family protein [Alphaproteobacteria bacterium]
MANRKALVGGCLCGAVRYKVRGPLRDVANCHCGQCRKFHGHIGAYTNAKTKDLTFTADSGLTWFTSSRIARRGFCRVCGSSLFWQALGGDTTSIAAGTLDGPTGLTTNRQIFTGKQHRGDYYAVDTHLQTFSGTMSG